MRRRVLHAQRETLLGRWLGVAAALHVGALAWAATRDGGRPRSSAPTGLGPIEIATALNAAVAKAPRREERTPPPLADKPAPERRATRGKLVPKPPSPRPPSPPPDPRDHLQEKFAKALSAVAAEASRILTSTEGKGPPFTSGNAETASGMVAGDGTGTSPTYDAYAAHGGTPGGAGPPPPPDLSRGPSVTMGYNDDCGFPAEADRDRVDHGWAMLVVTVRANGRAAAVQVLDDSGHGFGRMAQKCALRGRYEPALDKAGVPTQANTPPFRYRFTR